MTSDADLVRPPFRASSIRLFARYSVREIFSQRRTDIQRES